MPVSRGGSVIVLRQSTEPLTRQNAAVADGLGRHLHDHLIAQALMVAFAMIVLDELANGSPEGRFTDKNDPVQAGFLDRPYEALRVHVEIRGTRRQADDLNACGGECLAERHGEPRIPIVDQKALAHQKAIVGICHVATHLTHPGRVGLRLDPGDLDSARRKFDDEEHGKPRQPATAPDFDVKKSVAARTSQ